MYPSMCRVFFGFLAAFGGRIMTRSNVLVLIKYLVFRDLSHGNWSHEQRDFCQEKMKCSHIEPRSCLQVTMTYGNKRTCEICSLATATHVMVAQLRGWGRSYFCRILRQFLKWKRLSSAPVGQNSILTAKSKRSDLFTPE